MPLKSKQPRIVPLEPPFDAEAADVLERLGPPIQLFRVWARRPDLARGVASWGRYYFSTQSALTVRQRELVIHRTTARCGADYEWGVHVAAFAEKAGFDEAQLGSLAAGSPSDACWDAADRAVLTAVDELRATADLSDETWAHLVAASGEDGALDVLLVCGWYHAISFTVRALRLPLEPGTTRPDSP
ncbi:carboxymuconolactone decarboxylase family protein [Amycolatopsis sp. NBC_01488]|uniref:carboxymuconolactone decarboxylase family protein n=1 Tax=Amycolatopsis sp. NBC_01488 TaxID=2903563 RepID=UPI002E2DD071|nr:carboxymuconolactone decarboxylase family protein [Amycolatopsis sp. NBC_01488]